MPKLKLPWRHMTQPDITLAEECEGCVCRDEMSFDEACSQTAFLTMTAMPVPLKLQLFFLCLDKENQVQFINYEWKWISFSIHGCVLCPHFFKTRQQNLALTLSLYWFKASFFTGRGNYTGPSFWSHCYTQFGTESAHSYCFRILSWS